MENYQVYPINEEDELHSLKTISVTLQMPTLTQES